MGKEQIQDKINTIHNEIKRLQDEEIVLQEKLRLIIIDENTNAALNELNEIDENNSMSVHLYDDTRTTPIMDAFHNSDKRFLVFENIFSIGKNWDRVSLVVAKKRREVKLINSGLTMTDLKKHSGTTVRDYILKQMSETSRFYSLAKELITAADKISAGKKCIPFENLIRLGGQTFANQTGYGSSYEGAYQVTQGTLYGETTGFFIIGILTQKV